MSESIVDDVLHARYYQPGESSWADICHRVANYIGNTDSEREEYYQLMFDKIFLPNSPTIMNAGTDNPMLSACFVLLPDDSMESIFTTIKNAALIHKSGGGTGFTFGHLRPEGADVCGTGGVASGPISFMKVFNAATDAVKQGSKRRGANMGVLPVWHPDIEKFISCKEEEGALSNFNISVMIDDTFMIAVEVDGDYDLKFDGKIYKTVRAKELFDKIVEHTWKNGEPGVIFYDTVNRDIKDGEEKIEATNPCVIGDTLILTSDGYKRIDECIGKETSIWNGYEWSVVIPRVTGENQKVMEISFSDGSHLTCTPYHKFVIANSYKKEDIIIKQADQLHNGDKIIKCNYPVIEGNKELKDAYTHGFYSGDGGFNTQKQQCQIWLYDKKKDLSEFINACKFYNDPNRNRILAYLDGDYDKCFVPSCEYTIKSRLEWLAGIIDSDGCNNSSEGSITISSIDKDFLMNIKYMLNTLGINTSVKIMKYACTKLMPDGHGGSKECECLDSYRIVIAASDVTQLVSLGLQTHRVSTKCSPKRGAKRYIYVDSVKYVDELADKVYCFTEPKNHTGIFNGVITSQCGEQPLLSNESCNLGSIDVSKFVVDSEFDWDSFYTTVEIATGFLNSVIDKNKYPLPEIEEKTKASRKIGLGIMGFHDALIKMGVPYESDDALWFAEGLMNGITNHSHHYSSVKEWHNKATTCIAPTGSIATLAGCSYGIEPIFSLVHMRYTWASGEKVGYKQIHPMFEHDLFMLYPDDEDKFQTVINHAFEKGTIQDIDWLPLDFREKYKTALDIPWEHHIAMQAAFQKYCDAGISKTINMPSTATKQDVGNAIIMAWKSGCKGTTIYRSGSRENEVLELKKEDSGEDEMSQEELDALQDDYDRFAGSPRPQILNGSTYKMKSGCGKLYITINERNGRPYEVFIQTAGSGGCQANSEAIGRLFSLALRTGVPSKEIIKQLKRVKCAAAIKNGCDGKSCADIIAKCIEEFYSVIEEEGDSDVTVIVSDEKLTIPTDTYRPKCPECGEYLTLAEGCMVCGACGWSKCK